MLWNHLYEKDPGDTMDVPGAPLHLGDPLRTPLGPPGTRLGPPGTPLGPPGDAPRTPGYFRRPCMDHKHGHISSNIQRQKLSIAAFEAACWDPSHERLPRAVLSIKSLQK